MFLARVFSGDRGRLQLVKPDFLFGIDHCVGLLCVQGEIPLPGSGNGSGRPKSVYEVKLSHCVGVPDAEKGTVTAEIVRVA